jgi:hypothetical protein
MIVTARTQTGRHRLCREIPPVILEILSAIEEQDDEGTAFDTREELGLSAEEAAMHIEPPDDA